MTGNGHTTVLGTIGGTLAGVLGSEDINVLWHAALGAAVGFVVTKLLELIYNRFIKPGK